MQFKVFHIAITGDSDAEEVLNKFLRSHTVYTNDHLAQRVLNQCFSLSALLSGLYTIPVLFV